jgi:flagellar biosynthesis chaperone FliJ
MPFKWSLQRLMDVTDKRELALKAELYELSRRIAAVELDIQHRRELIDQTLADLCEAEINQRLCRHDVLMQSLAGVENEIKTFRGRLWQLGAEREEKTRQLVALQAKKENLHKLRDKARREYDRLLALKEQKQMDEIFQMNYARDVQQRLVVRPA